MDINYFINILQQNTETIKQLNERIKLLEEINLLEKSEKEDNLTTLIKDVQLMKLKESNKNKQLKEQIELLENENKQLKKQMEKTNANMIKYCDIIKTLEYQSTKQRERICLLEQGFKQLDERDKMVKDEFKDLQNNVSKLFDCVSPFAINTYSPLSSPILFLPSQKSRWHNNIVQKTNYYLNLEYLIIENFNQSSISELQIQNNKLHTLFIFPTYSTQGKGSQHIISYLNWTLDGIENIPNLKCVFIYNAFGLKNVYESLLKCENNIETIEIHHSLHISNEEIDKIKKLCIERKIIINFIGHHASLVLSHYISYNENDITDLFTKDLNDTIKFVKSHKFVKISKQQYTVY